MMTQSMVCEWRHNQPQISLKSFCDSFKLKLKQFYVITCSELNLFRPICWPTRGTRTIKVGNLLTSLCSCAKLEVLTLCHRSSCII